MDPSDAGKNPVSITWRKWLQEGKKTVIRTYLMESNLEGALEFQKALLENEIVEPVSIFPEKPKQ